jgi:hypothetical protein
MTTKHWIEDAIRKPAAEKKAETHDEDSGKAGRRARLAEILMKLRGKK